MSTAQGWAHSNAWIAFEADMNSVLEPVTDLLLTQVGDVAGRHVLDIGCGTGAVASRLVDAGALVTASDVSADFLSFVEAHVTGVETHLEDAQTASWPRLFDLVVSRFGVMFFTDPKAAFSNIAQALKPGGRMIFVAWAPYEENPWFHVPYHAACDVLGVSAPSPDPHSSGPFGLSDQDWALHRMRGDELTGLQCETVSVTLSHPKGVRAAAELSTRIGFAARVLREQEADEATRGRVVAAITDALSVFEVQGTMQMPAALHVYSAQRV